MVAVSFGLTLSNAEHEVQSYLSEFELSNCPCLEQRLDSDGRGVESDLIEIAMQIPDWEEKLVAPLQLTQVHVSDIKRRNQNCPELQR
jgi:hypothetical protein